jgi:predicted nucleotide-binding protein (sugar kinase/HSP70/actin superfamily)
MEADRNNRVNEPSATSLGDDDRIAGERKRLLREAGLDKTAPRHFKRPVERAFTRSERDKVTVLFGGLTECQDRLIKAGLEGLGYLAEMVPVPTKSDFQAGKEYGNNGQCNPTYFTVGALVNHLKHKRDEEQVPTERILSDYIFVTAGACGPCRFGMYEAEYRLALRNSGFDGFRVVLFDQTAGMEQSAEGAGFEINPRLFLTLLNAIFIGDLLNAVIYHIRPYETQPGKTQELYERCMQICEQALRTKHNEPLRPSVLAKLLSKVAPVDNPDDLERFLDQVRSRHFVEALERCRELIDEGVEVDYTRPKPTVKITGEFWAQTTEGDGNFHMFSFLEKEGAEVLVEPVATWVDYMAHDVQLYLDDRKGLVEGEEPVRFWGLGKKLKVHSDYIKQSLAVKVGEKVLYREYERMRNALGGTVHPLANQLELQRVGHPYYNSRASGGEGYLEVAKNIYYFNHELAHMTLSLKPFGCMPSTQSDGAQAAVVSHYPEMIYLPIETSGEGDINAYSRVQMALGEAKVKCKDEFKAAVARSGYALEDIRAYVTEHRELRRPLYKVPHVKGVIGRAANFVLHIGSLMDGDPKWSARKQRAPGQQGGMVGQTAAG